MLLQRGNLREKGMEAQTQERTTTGTERFPAPPSDIDLKVVEVPAATPEQREQMRRNIEMEIFTARQERNYLAEDRLDEFGRCKGYGIDPDAVPTNVKAVRDVVLGRVRAMNPFRDFDKVGAGLIVDTEGSACSGGVPVLAIGTVSGIIAGMTAAYFGASPLLVLGAGVVGAAPVFIATWGARTVFNLAAGILTAVAAPFAYAAARIADVRHNPGLLAAKEYLKELRRSGLGWREQYEKKDEKIAELDRTIGDAAEALAKVDGTQPDVN